MISTFLDLTVRVGCHLEYAASHPTAACFVVRPRVDDSHLITAERFSITPGRVDEDYIDIHGNVMSRTTFQLGQNIVAHDAMVAVSSAREPDFSGQPAIPISRLPADTLRYMLPSRYCDSDRLREFAWDHFGKVEQGGARVQAICDWIHSNIEYRFGSGSAELTAYDVIDRRFGVCRDFAHAVIALCRTFNIPARYVTGHLPDIGCRDSGVPGDFHAYCEVYLGGAWWTVDARFNRPRIGRIKVAHGLDAVDGAFGTIYGDAQLTYFEVWTYQVDPAKVNLGDPRDLSKRLDDSIDVRFPQQPLPA